MGLADMQAGAIKPPEPPAFCCLGDVLLEVLDACDTLLKGEDDLAGLDDLGPLLVIIREAGEMLGLRGEYRGDAKTGKNWAECH